MTSQKTFVNIQTEHRPKPIPIRNFDWIATYEGHEEDGYGHGSTEVEAIADLRDTIGEQLGFD